LSSSTSPELAKLGNAEAACTSAPYVKKFAPVQAALLMFGKKASKSACVNHAPMPSPLVPGDGAVVGLLCAGVDALDEDVDAGGAVVDDASAEEDVDEGGAVVDSPPEQPAAFQIDSALQ
jgi:hypothetical protein